MRTHPPAGEGDAVVIYDGRCPFCTRQVERLKRFAGPDKKIRFESFQDPSVLARFPQLSYDDCMKEIKLVTAEGKIFGGAHAIFSVLGRNPFFRPLRWLYDCPVLKPLFDLGYRMVARNRYQIPSHDCPSGTCARHQEERTHRSGF